MTRTDHIFALISSALTADEKHFDSCLSSIASTYEIIEIRKLNAVSLGADNGDADLPLSTWIEDLRDQSVSKVTCLNFHPADDRLPAHIAAAFSGSVNMLMEVVTSNGAGVYVLETFRSARYDISAQNFAELMDSQEAPDLAWARATTLMLESNRLNGRAVFEQSQTRSYLDSSEGTHVFGYLADNLVKEIQIEVAINKNEFVIPGSLQSFFVKREMPEFFRDDHEHVYLYTLKDVNSEQVLQLVGAQSFGPKTWEATNKMLTEHADPDLLPIPVEDWEESIRNMEPAKLNRVVNTICRSICTLCEAEQLKPLIPHALHDFFGPDEMDQKRAAIRSKIDMKGWSLQTSTKPWEYYRLKKIVFEEPLPAVDVSETRAAFINSLNAIHRFAVSVQSTFEEAFGLSLFVLSESFLIGNYDEQHLNQLTKDLRTAKFSDRAIENFGASTWMGSGFLKMGWDDKRTRDLLAINLSDIFGGMGSWNDQYFESEQATYDAVTSGLYDSLKKHFGAIISYRS